MATTKEQVDWPLTDKALDKIIIDLSQRQTKHGEDRDQKIFFRHEKERDIVGNARLLVVKSITPRFHLTATIPWTTHVQTPLGITFADLPFELRDKIWGYAMLEGRIIKLGGKKVLSSESDGLNPYQSNPEKRWSRAGIPTQKDRDVPKQLADTGAYWADKGEFAELTREELRSLETTSHWDEALKTLQEKVNTTKSDAANAKRLHPRKIPSLLRVNKESREIALQHYSLILGPQRAGKPIYFNFAVDALYVQDDWDLLVLCGIENPEGTNHLFTTSLYQGFPSQKNEIEENLRFLVIDDSLEYTTMQGLARFRNLEKLLIKPKKKYSSQNLFTQFFLGYDSGPAEETLKEWWRDDDEERGRDSKPTSIPQFLYFKIPRRALLRDGNAINYISRQG